MPLALEASGIWLAVLSRVDDGADCLARRGSKLAREVKERAGTLCACAITWRPSVVRRKVWNAVTAPYKFKRIWGTIPNIFQ
jgi:hypothetical protein